MRAFRHPLSGEVDAARALLAPTNVRFDHGSAQRCLFERRSGKLATGRGFEVRVGFGVAVPDALGTVPDRTERHPGRPLHPERVRRHVSFLVQAARLRRIAARVRCADGRSHCLVAVALTD